MWPVRLSEGLAFPDPATAQDGEPPGLVAVGGDLSTDRLLLAYRSGLFPWTVHPITWWSPDPRAIIELDRLHISRSLDRVLRRGDYTITRNQAFRAVMEGCAEPAPGRRRTWISPAFLQAYTGLHQAGHAHSVECWLGDRLVGGIYGVAVGGLFAGESMFQRADNASKVALVHLVRHLQATGFVLFDIQMLTRVTAQMGAEEIPRRDYLERLQGAVALTVAF